MLQNIYALVPATDHSAKGLEITSSEKDELNGTMRNSGSFHLAKNGGPASGSLRQHLCNMARSQVNCSCEASA
ncbi:unnamed protein product, partial [Amoebophrya sp. A25]|eukprot:GSA25T00015790001.1